MTDSLLPTTVVGSYPQPDWLIDRAMLKQTVPRVRTPQMWRIAPPFLEQAQDDATLLAIRDMELAGIDIITDGEMRRESYSNRFATAFEGIDNENPAMVTGRLGKPVAVPRVVGRIARPHPIEVRDVRFLRANTDRAIKITLPGPFTMGRQAKDEFYGDDEELAMAFADAVNEEIHDLKAAGADVIQLDEPWLQAFPEPAARYGARAIDRALRDVDGVTVLHICFGYSQFVSDKQRAGYIGLENFAESSVRQISIEAAQPRLDLSFLKDIPDKKIVLGVIDLGAREVETAQDVAARIRSALDHVDADRLIPAPDCGMKYLDRATAFGKLRALSEGAALVRNELT